MHLSFIIPAYNERGTLADLVAGIHEHAAPHETEIILIDDGSTDGSAEVLAQLAGEHGSIHVITFRQNLGKSAALAAGLAKATGERVFTMDADLQDDPAEIPRFMEKLDEGFDMVCGWKKTRHDPWHKTFPSKLYNGFVARLFGLPLHDVNCGYKAMTISVAKHIRVYGDRHRLIPILAQEAGFTLAEIPVEHHPRRYGKSKYGFERFTRGAMDVLSVWFLSRYRYSPGHFFGTWSALFFLAGLAALGGAWFLWPPTQPGFWPVALIALGSIAWSAAILFVAVALLAELIVRDFVGGDFRKGVDDEKRA